MVLEPRVLLDASIVDTTGVEAMGDADVDLDFDIPVIEVSDSGDRSSEKRIPPDLATIRTWLHTATTHQARLSIVVKLWDGRPGDRVSLADGYTGSGILEEETRRELLLEVRAGAMSSAQDVAEAFVDALEAVQLETSRDKDSSTREVWVFPSLSGASEVACRADKNSGMVRYYVLEASLGSYADARRTAEQQRFFGAAGCLGHFSSDAEKAMYGSMAQGRPLWLGLRIRRVSGRCRAVRGKGRFFGAGPAPMQAYTVRERQAPAGEKPTGRSFGERTTFHEDRLRMRGRVFPLPCSPAMTRSCF